MNFSNKKFMRNADTLVRKRHPRLNAIKIFSNAFAFVRTRVSAFRAIIFLCLSVSFFFVAACQKTEVSDSNEPDFFGLTDETQASAEIVEEANNDLKKIRKMYKENQSKLDELKNAMNEKDIGNAKKLADQLVDVITEGSNLGDSAIEKLEKAQAMKINAQYREYLELKKQSLKYQMTAYDYRRQFAIALRDGFGTKDKFAVEKAKSDFKDYEENFLTYMEKARQFSGEANQLAKDALNRDN